MARACCSARVAGVGDAGAGPIFPRNAGVFGADIAGDQTAIGGQRGRHAERAVAREDADLQRLPHPQQARHEEVAGFMQEDAGEEQQGKQAEGHVQPAGEQQKQRLDLEMDAPLDEDGRPEQHQQPDQPIPPAEEQFHAEKPR